MAATQIAAVDSLQPTIAITTLPIQSPVDDTVVPLFMKASLTRCEDEVRLLPSIRVLLLKLTSCLYPPRSFWLHTANSCAGCDSGLWVHGRGPRAGRWNPCPSSSVRGEPGGACTIWLRLTCYPHSGFPRTATASSAIHPSSCYPLPLSTIVSTMSKQTCSMIISTISPTHQKA